MFNNKAKMIVKYYVNKDPYSNVPTQSILNYSIVAKSTAKNVFTFQKKR